jgi:alpha-L-fucosidase
MPYQPTLDSLQQHAVPDWFHDAKLGIFIHWGLYSVPAWAPHGDDIDKQVAEKGWEAMFANNPYSEWYLNSYRNGMTPTRRHHIATYGDQFTYDDFAPMFDHAASTWDADSWAALFARVGARYAVLTTKHHDGYLLWNSARTSPMKPPGYASTRDLVGDFAAAVRARGMKVGLYYSGGLDWSFETRPVRNFIDVYGTIVQTPEFIDYVDFHWRELMERYQPSILWNDIGAPANYDTFKLFADYYNAVPDGLVNDRWSKGVPSAEVVPKAGEPIGPPPSPHRDYTTPEYGSYPEIVPHKWESCRGIGHSFGYNQNEGESDYLSPQALIHSFIDIVSKNGNLLLDVGPMADGTIPAMQVERLEALGAWLDVNGSAIFGTRPYTRAEGVTTDGLGVRFTRAGETTYAILLGTPATSTVTLVDVNVPDGARATLLGHDAPLTWTRDGDNVTVTLPHGVQPAIAHTLAFQSA